MSRLPLPDHSDEELNTLGRGILPHMRRSAAVWLAIPSVAFIVAFGTLASVLPGAVLALAPLLYLLGIGVAFVFWYRIESRRAKAIQEELMRRGLSPNGHGGPAPDSTATAAFTATMRRRLNTPLVGAGVATLGVVSCVSILILFDLPDGSWVFPLSGAFMVLDLVFVVWAVLALASVKRLAQRVEREGSNSSPGHA